MLYIFIRGEGHLTQNFEILAERIRPVYPMKQHYKYEIHKLKMVFSITERFAA